jgi:hypothetical protein
MAVRSVMTERSEELLLGHLATHGWFAQNGEVALTSALTFCLNKDPAAAGAFVRLVHDLAGSDVTSPPLPDRWQAEWVDENRQRPDLVGWYHNGRDRVPGIVVEAKVSAGFSYRQVSYYVRHQQELLERALGNNGFLVVLVPHDRVSAASEEVAVDLAELGTSPGAPWIVNGPATVRVIVMSWAEALEAMLRAGGPAGEDIRQLAAASRVLREPDIRAFNVADLRGDWKDRLDDLHTLIDAVTRKATTALQEVGLDAPHLPWQRNPSGGLAGGFRYIGVRDEPNLAVGIAAPEVAARWSDADDAESPLWVRWHRATTDADQIQNRLLQHDLVTARDRSGLIWMPLRLEPDVGLADRQIQHAVERVVEAFLAGCRPR